MFNKFRPIVYSTKWFIPNWLVLGDVVVEQFETIL